MTDHNFSPSRRRFIQTAATAAVAAPFIIRCTSGDKAPNILRHACIGVGGMGWSDLQKFKEDPNVKIVAICDVDSENLKKASEALPDARTYTDWRELLKKEVRNIEKSIQTRSQGDSRKKLIPWLKRLPKSRDEPEK